MSPVYQWLDARRWQALAFTLPVVVLLHLAASAVMIRHSNQDWTASDQGAEMWLAATAREDVLPQRTDGVRHPMWSWVARHFYTEDKAEFFARGKWLNTALCVAFLCGLGMASARWLDPLATANVLLLCSLGILLVRGTYFQPEPLYYIFSFLAAVLGWRLLRGAGLWHYAGFGVLCGLAYLSKPSLAPFLMVFCGAFGLRSALAAVCRNREWLARNVSGLALSLAILGMMLVPLARFSAEHFGKPLFNYTKYWMWMDDFMTESWPFQDKYPGRVQLETLPKEETPSLAWYFRRHTAGEAWQRLAHGAGDVAVKFFFPEQKLGWKAIFVRPMNRKWEQPLAHRGAYLIALAALCAGLGVMGRKLVASRLMDPANVSRLAFVLGLIAIYAGLYGWYWPIGKGDRFMGSLWMPGVFLLVWAASRLRSLCSTGRADGFYLGVHAAVCLSLLIQAAGMLWRFGHGVYLVTRN